MTDDEKRAKMTGKPAKNAENGEIVESLNRVLDEISGSIFQTTERLHNVLSSLYTRDLESLNADEIALLIDFQDNENPGVLVPIVIDQIKKYKAENKIETLTVANALDTETGKEIGLYKDEKELANPDTPACIFDVIMHRARDAMEKAEKNKIERQLQGVYVPEKYVMLNSRLAKRDKLNKALNMNGTARLFLDPKHEKTSPVTPLEIVMLNTENVLIKGDYTAFDAEIMDAAATLYLEGSASHLITPRLVARTIAQSNRVSAQLQQTVRESIVKLRFIYGNCDVSDITAGKSDIRTIGGPLLDLQDVTFRNGEQGFYITHEPLLLEYSRLVSKSEGGETRTIPAYLRDIRVIENGQMTGKSISNTKERIVIKGYLIRFIEMLKYNLKKAKNALTQNEKRRKAAEKKNKPTPPEKTLQDYMINKNNRMLYNTLFDETGLAGSGRQALSNYRDYIKSCLDYWVAVGYIAGYKVVADDKKKTEKGIDIILEKPNDKQVM